MTPEDAELYEARKWQVKYPPQTMAISCKKLFSNNNKKLISQKKYSKTNLNSSNNGFVIPSRLLPPVKNSFYERDERHIFITNNVLVFFAADNKNKMSPAAAAAISPEFSRLATKFNNNTTGLLSPDGNPIPVDLAEKSTIKKHVSVQSKFELLPTFDILTSASDHHEKIVNERPCTYGDAVKPLNNAKNNNCFQTRVKTFTYSYYEVTIIGINQIDDQFTLMKAHNGYDKNDCNNSKLKKNYNRTNQKNNSILSRVEKKVMADKTVIPKESDYVNTLTFAVDNSDLDRADGQQEQPHPQQQQVINNDNNADNDNEHILTFYPEDDLEKDKDMMESDFITITGDINVDMDDDFGDLPKEESQEHDSKSDEAIHVAVGFSTRPYPYFRLPGLDKYSIAYHTKVQSSPQVIII
eukprot:Awhi_evm1s15431